MGTDLTVVNTARVSFDRESDPVYDENGVEDQERSRRVEIKFRLKDAEMIQRMNSILSSME